MSCVTMCVITPMTLYAHNIVNQRDVIEAHVDHKMGPKS